MIRFELEQELISGTLDTDDLPEAWNARVHEYLGLEVPDDRLGVLQDVHWSGGGFGYFPTYQLGNVVSLQIWDKACEAIPDLDAQIERGEFGELHEWLRANVYAHGRKYMPPELLERVVGGATRRGAVPALPAREVRLAGRRIASGEGRRGGSAPTGLVGAGPLGRPRSSPTPRRARSALRSGRAAARGRRRSARRSDAGTLAENTHGLRVAERGSGRPAPTRARRTRRRR